MWEAEEKDSVQDNKGEGKGKCSMKSWLQSLALYKLDVAGYT